ncbi:MAG: HesA/MoeB/ThiF family protein [Eggerthellaceae bacterium]|nr:HesA/MoeB/ThiF family protein [Eggerthellaceae bacterium]
MVVDAETRYARQLILPAIGEEGQRRIEAARVAVLGVGALGSVIASLLCRNGVGFIRVIDRDLVGLSNLHRGSLYTEADVAAEKPKAIACAECLRAINHNVQVDPVVQDISPRSIEALIADVEVVLDGSDNLELRYLINDACHKLAKPWVHGSIRGTSGAFMTVLPQGPCLRCLNPDAPAPGSYPTCATEGVLGASTDMVGALQAIEALKLILGSPDVARGYYSLDCWHAEIDRIDLKQDPDCPCCVHGVYDYLDQS